VSAADPADASKREESAPPRGLGGRATTTLVIPVKNDAEMLARCLRSIQAQTIAPDEVIVVDNDSTDDSAAVAGCAGATVLSCTVPGIAAAASHGYDHACGEIILRIDADCIPSDTWVETVHAAFAAHPHVSAFSGGARFNDGPSWLRAPLAGLYLLAYAAATAPALGHLLLFGSNLALTRVAWNDIRDEVHRLDANVHDDLDLAFHLGRTHAIGYLPSSTMGVSSRPFRSPGSLLERVRRGFHTVAIHWPRDFPPARWRARATSSCRAN